MQNYTFRLKPEQDLLDSIQAFAMEQHVQAGCILPKSTGTIVSGVGSLSQATLRLADQEYNSEHKGPFEIVSITGTVSVHGSHLHISISDRDGKRSAGILSLVAKSIQQPKL